MTDAALGPPPPPLASGDRVGFVGLGKMGQPMLARLASAGYEIVGYDLDEASRCRARERVPAAMIADQVGAVAAGTRAVILMLPDSAAVQSVLAGPLSDRLAAGHLVIDMGSSEPAETVRHSEELAARGVALVDAPVSGGISGAEAGTLTVIVGGLTSEIDRAKPLLSALGSRIVPVGQPGAGHAVKALNNLLSATHLLATCEAMSAARRFGLDLSVVLDAVNTSSGRSGSSEVKWPRYILEQTYHSGFALRLMVKDVTIALSLARSLGASSALSEEVRRRWELAAQALPAGADHTEIARWVEDPGTATSASFRG
jgi:3-hydroxyisobutyrate dehydrogenase